MSPGQFDLMRLSLVGNAALAAKELSDEFSSIEFTSGRRDVDDQARAMAQNVVLNRRWIAQTYKATPLAQACQRWVSAHKESVSVPSIAAGILSVIRAYPPDTWSSLSKHLTGEAFDVRPVAGLAGSQILSAIRRVVAKYDGKFLDNEGGLTRWHAQF